MDGLIWTFIVWGALFSVCARVRNRVTAVNDWFSREHLSLALALLGTFSIAARADAEEVLRQPVVMERIVRGGLAIAALLMVTPLVVQRLRGYRRGHRALTGLMVYLLVALVSTVYSAAPLITAAKVLELTAGLAPIVAIALGEHPARRLRSAILLVIALSGSLVITAVVGFVALPSVFAPVQSRPGFILARTMGSPYAHSNSLAAHGAIVAVFCLASFLTRNMPRRLAIVAGLLGLAGVVLSSGRQGVAMVVVGVAIVLWAQRRALFLTLLGPGLGATAYAYRDTLFSALSRNRPGNFTNFTGRLYWWEAAIDAWIQHPWTGWGYAAGGRFVALASLGRGRTSSVHSGYIEALVGVGVIGLVGLTYTFFAVVRWSWKHLRSETELAVLIALLALRTAVSQGFGGWLNVEFAMFALLAAIADRTRIDARRSEREVPQPVLVPVG